MLDKLEKVKENYRMKINIEKFKVIRISRKCKIIWTYMIIKLEQNVKEVEQLNYLGRMITNYDKCTKKLECLQ